jgi:hypothetical protein
LLSIVFIGFVAMKYIAIDDVAIDKKRPQLEAIFVGFFPRFSRYPNSQITDAHPA